MKTCPMCAEEIQDAAKICKHCGASQVQEPEPEGSDTGFGIPSTGPKAVSNTVEPPPPPKPPRDEEKTADTRRDECYRLLFGVRRSVLYHRQRQRFLERLHNFSALLTAVAGSTTAVTVISSKWPRLAPVAAALTALLSALDLVFNAARVAWRHDALARAFIALEQELERAGPVPSAEALRDLQIRRLAIEADEPPIYRALDAMCHDELLTALGREAEHRTNVSWWQRRLSNWFLRPGLHRLRKRVDTPAR